jgi:hypothetical protein
MNGFQKSAGLKVVKVGGMIAVVISWSLHHTVAWALLHGILGWFYVLYAVAVHAVRLF